MKKTKTKCYLYTRVSTSMQVDGYSLDAQRDKLRKYAEYEDMVVAGEYSDEGFSGKNIQGRHEFQRMLQDIQDCKDGVEYVLVFKLSRFGRNAADVLNSLQLMQDFGVNLICVEDGIDSSKDSGKLMISVLSAVAEIERENIRTQTMAGREQKAREGKWNGGFAPYGYRLEKGELLIAEDEVDVIRTIFDRYIHTNDGVSGVAKYLNRQGFVKKLRQNGTIPGFSASFVKSIIDNPVYMGKIAYGRRRTEKKIGTRNEMHVVEQSEFPVYEGKHEAIISEEDWNLAQEKRKINAYRREKVNDPTHAHILSGILKCPCCGKSLYGNIAKAHSKDKKTRYYYYCKNTVTPTGHECTFRLNIEQMEMNRMVASIISAMVSDPRFADAIKAKIGSAVDTNDLEKQLEALQAQLRQTLGTKARLERQMDGLDVNDPYYDRKISDLQRRYDEQYGAIDEIEVQIDDVQSQIRSIRQEKISGDNIYRLLLAFDQVYEAASEVERKEFMRAFIERIELFPEKQPDGNWIRKIIFNFPVPVNGTEVKELPLENETIVEPCVVDIFQCDAAVVDGFVSGGHGKLGKPRHFAGFAPVNTFGRVKIFDFCGQFHLKIRCIKSRDRPNGAAASFHGGPAFRHGIAGWVYRAKAGDNDPAFLFYLHSCTSHSHSAVNTKNLPGDVTGLFPGQESHRRGNIFSTADSACRDGRCGCGAGRFRHSGGHIGFNKSRCHRIGGNIACGVLFGNAFR